MTTLAIPVADFTNGRYRSRSNQGAALIVALMLLLVLSVLGISASQKSTMQLKMASNTQNRDMAFQAAEYALAEADDYILTNRDTLKSYGCPTDPNASDGIRCEDTAGSMHANTANYWQSNLTCGTDTISVTIDEATFSDSETFNDKLNASACYVIEILFPTENCSSASNRSCSGTPPTCTPLSCNFFRVTARSVGGTDAAVVILQTMYEYP